MSDKEPLIWKITFNRDMEESDFRDMREMFGDKLLQEDTRSIVVAFDSVIDYLAFVAAFGIRTKV